jgi:hypothetical protein
MASMNFSRRRSNGNIRLSIWNTNSATFKLRPMDEEDLEESEGSVLHPRSWG